MVKINCNVKKPGKNCLMMTSPKKRKSLCILQPQRSATKGTLPCLANLCAAVIFPMTSTAQQQLLATLLPLTCHHNIFTAVLPLFLTEPPTLPQPPTTIQASKLKVPAVRLT